MSKEPPAKDRLMTAAKHLFADQGFKATSVREICAAAGTSSTMIHHYFGNKEGLYDEILRQFSSDTFALPLRIIAQPANSPDDFTTRMELFISETFHALIAEESTFRILARRGSEFVELKNYHETLAEFLNAAQQAGHVRHDLKIEMVTGALLDRLGMQILYAAQLTDKSAPNVLTDPDYLIEWLAANTELFIFGLASRHPT